MFRRCSRTALVISSHAVLWNGPASTIPLYSIVPASVPVQKVSKTNVSVFWRTDCSCLGREELSRNASAHYGLFFYSFQVNHANEWSNFLQHFIGWKECANGSVALKHLYLRWATSSSSQILLDSSQKYYISLMFPLGKEMWNDHGYC